MGDSERKIGWHDEKRQSHLSVSQSAAVGAGIPKNNHKLRRPQNKSPLIYGANIFQNLSALDILRDGVSEEEWNKKSALMMIKKIIIVHKYTVTFTECALARFR